MIKEFIKDGKIYERLCDTLVKIPTFPKSSTAGQSKFSYKYTDLDTIVTKVVPILQENGLGYLQSLTTIDGKSAICTRLFSRDGEWLEDQTVLPVIDSKSVNEAQALGMSITYMRRYALCAMLGITSDQDVDANTFDAAEGKGKESPKKEPPKKTPPRRNDAPPPQKQSRMNSAEAARVKDIFENSGAFSKEEQDEWRRKWAQHKEWTAAQFIKMLEDVVYQDGEEESPDMPPNEAEAEGYDDAE